ncbi:hypothetical protein DQ04_00071180 [Trypanosoma grayi]|uniref:hypothetical protein n=1 Tax=Trypanosoma grayi TaxID=71804 RepID=UPI0004F471F1|nr:hypothetical protein DQ04_00071180 [Trypanosoma grayi]KEG15450.1 hypothetical protein DQ04_00071180 [Trypanosoma grayi]
MGSLPSGTGEGWSARWPSPTLQVVDIQRYPKVVVQPSVVSRFYLAVSDSDSLLWLVIPPGSEVEELVHTFQIEVGCCITLIDYTVITAKNGLNVVVPVSISYSGTQLSLIGNPTFDSSLFSLSREALTNRRGSARLGTFRASGKSTTLSLSYIVETEGESLGDFAVHVRMVWKGKQRQLPMGGAVDRFVFDGVGVDSKGDAIWMSFFGSSLLYDVFSVDDCVRATNGTLMSRGDANELLRLQFDERSSGVFCDAEEKEKEEEGAIPKCPQRMFGARAVKDVLEQGTIGDITSVEGVVATVFPAAFVDTRRGRVERAGVLLRDSTSPWRTLDVTLWSEQARDVRPAVGDRWCFCGFGVSEYMRRLTLSSRYASAAFQMQSGPANQQHQQQKQQQPQQWGDCLTEQARADSIPLRDTLQATLSLDEASETLPVLAKIQRVKLPLTYTACRGCGRPRSSGVFHCAACGETATEERFVVRLELSDGIRVVSAVGFALVGESLFGVDIPTLLRRRGESPAFERDMTREVVGLPLLFWLLRSPDALLHVVNCRHIGMAQCAATVLAAVEQMMELP